MIKDLTQSRWMNVRGLIQMFIWHTADVPHLLLMWLWMIQQLHSLLHIYHMFSMYMVRVCTCGQMTTDDLKSFINCCVTVHLLFLCIVWTVLCLMSETRRVVQCFIFILYIFFCHSFKMKQKMFIRYFSYHHIIVLSVSHIDYFLAACNTINIGHHE